MPNLSSFASFTSFFSSQDAPKASSSVRNYIFQHGNFHPNEREDKDLLTTCTTELQTKLAELQVLDLHIIAGFAVGTGAFTLSSLLPFGVTMAIAGFGYSAYCIGKRERLALDYRVALSDAVACLNWTLGKVAVPGRDAVLKSIEVQTLFDTLSPLMDEKQIRDAIDDAVEDGFVEKARLKGQDLLGRPLNKDEKALVYGIYGYEQGGVLDVGKGLWYLACQTVNWMIQSVKSLWDHQEASSTNTNTP